MLSYSIGYSALEADSGNWNHSKGKVAKSIWFLLPVSDVNY